MGLKLTIVIGIGIFSNPLLTKRAGDGIEVGGAVERVVGQQGVVGQHEAVGQQEVVLGQGLEPRRQEVVALVVLFSRTTTRCLFAHSLEQSDPHWSS